MGYCVCKFDMVMNCPQSGGLALCCIEWVRYGVDVIVIVTEINCQGMGCGLDLSKPWDADPSGV